MEIKDFSKITLTESIRQREDALTKEIYYHIDRLDGRKAKMLVKILLSFYDTERAMAIIYDEILRMRRKK